MSKPNKSDTVATTKPRRITYSHQQVCLAFSLAQRDVVAAHNLDSPHRVHILSALNATLANLYGQKLGEMEIDAHAPTAFGVAMQMESTKKATA